MHHIQHVIQLGNGKTILYCYLVDCATIHAHTPSFIFLWRQQSGHCARTYAFLYKALLQQFVNLPLQLRMLSRIHPIIRQVGKTRFRD